MKALIPTGLKKAVIGSAFRTPGSPEVWVVSIERAAKILCARDGMTPAEAMEFLEVNSVCCWMGELTPIWMNDLPVKVRKLYR